MIGWFPDWTGDDVAIIASGPSTKTANIEQLRGKCRVIAIKENIDLCWAWADMVYGCDQSWWRNRNWLKDFPRLKVSFEAKHAGIERIDIDRHVDRILTETPGRIGSGGNSGFQAVNLAVQFGAKRIMLVGFDMTDRSGLHWYGRNRGQNRSNPTEDNFRRWRAAFHATAPWFREHGIDCDQRLGAFRRDGISQDDGREGIAAMAPYRVYVGWDPREAAAFAVTRASLIRHASEPIEVYGLVLSILQKQAFYWRPLKYKTTLSGHTMMWDVISGAPMATQFACSRFLVKELAREGWAIFCDSDFLFRADIVQLFRSLSDEYAVQCVKHAHNPDEISKMDGQVQTRYARKNWSSLYAINCTHPANDSLTLDLVNSVPGRQLHAFCWLKDNEIGDLDPAWNHLVSVNAPRVDAKGVHFTLGTPDMAGYEDCEYAAAWREELERWALGRS